MARFAVYADDQIFQGSHFMYSYSIFEGEENEAIEYAVEESLNIIDSYKRIYRILEEDIKNAIMESEVKLPEYEVEQIKNNIYLEDIHYNIYSINEDVAKNFSNEELEEMLQEDPKNFIDTYCYF